LEAKAFELEQRTALVQEAKQVLDSWVRYEGQVKQRQQRELAENVIGKIMKELENPKTLQQILQQSVADVESMFPKPSLHENYTVKEPRLTSPYRNRWVQGPVGLCGSATIVNYQSPDKTYNVPNMHVSNYSSLFALCIQFS